MKGTFKVSWRIALALALVLSLGVMTAPAAATPIEEYPSISPVAADYNLDMPYWLRPDVSTTVTNWACAHNVTVYHNNPNDMTIGIDYAVVGDTITIFKSWLSSPTGGNLQVINDQVVLTVLFQGPCLPQGNYTKPFVITAIGSCPSISPEMVTYDLTTCQIRTPVIQTQIAWGASPPVITNIRAYKGGVNPIFELLTDNLPFISANLSPLQLGIDYVVDGITLIILEPYLKSLEDNGLLANPGDSVVLEIEFVGSEYCHPANFTIMAVGDEPSIGPPSAEYDLCDPPTFVSTVINWGTATSLTITGANLNDEPTDIPTYPYEYKVATSVYVPPMGQHVDALMVWGTMYAAYLANHLQYPGDELVLEVTFDSQNPFTGTNHTALFTITAVAGTPPSLSSTSATVDLDAGPVPCRSAHNVSTLITWCCCDDCYNITKIVDRQLCANTTRVETLNATEDYDLKAECLGVSKLVFTTTYLDKVLKKIGDSVELTIVLCSWERADCYLVHPELTFTITATGSGATIDPTEAVFNLDVLDATNTTMGNNVTVEITWGYHANAVVAITDDVQPLWPLEANVDYIVGPRVGHVSNLTIMNTYLLEVLTNTGDDVVLTIVFDEGPAATLTITAIGGTAAPAEGEEEAMCFIATAVYGEDAEATNMLREFRDEYLLTNPLGRALVGLYYTVSPPIAEFLTEHPALQTIVRAMLLPALAMSTMVVNHPAATQMTLLVLLLVSIAVAVWATRRRERRGPAYA